MTGGLLALTGLGLIAIDIVGVARGLALYPLAKQFSDDERRLARTKAIGRYSQLRKRPEEGDESYATRVGQAIGDHLVHSIGSEFPRISIFQNWILWLLGVFVPSRFQFVEFRNTRYALEGGFRLCSQAALTLADVLSRARLPWPSASSKDTWSSRSRPRPTMDEGLGVDGAVPLKIRVEYDLFLRYRAKRVGPPPSSG